MAEQVARLSEPVRRRNMLTSSASTSGYRSVCKICRVSVRTDQDAVWSRKPMGLVHEACVREEPTCPA